MSKHNVITFGGRAGFVDPLTELLRTGAQNLIHPAVEAELEELLATQTNRRTQDGKAGVVRNGYLPMREIPTGVGPVTVRIPKVRAKTGEPVTFRSALVPPYVRKTRSLEVALPWLYLKGVSSGEMGEALKVLVGKEAKGLSASTVSRLKRVWAQESSGPKLCSFINPFKALLNGYCFERHHIRWAYEKLGLRSLAPGPHTSKAHPEHKVYPYLLRGFLIDSPNQVWSTDITYIRLNRGFVYLMAIIDWYSRYVLDWDLSISMEVDFCIETLARVSENE